MNRVRWIVAAVLMGVLAGCGGDDEPAADPTPTETVTATEPAPEPSAAAPTGALSTENLGDRCEELKSIVVTLRGVEPLEVKPSAAIDATYDGLPMRTSHCTYAYEGDTFSDPNRIDVYFDTAPGDLPGIRGHWEVLSFNETVDGVGEAASWYYNDTFDAESSSRTLIGDTVVSVRISVPKTEVGAAYLTKDAAVTALQAVVALM